jgi:hypothetical protein
LTIRRYLLPPGSWPQKLGLVFGHGAAFHDFHHTGNRGNYGGPEYLDYFLGTAEAWIDIGGEEGYLERAKHDPASDTAGKAE